MKNLALLLTTLALANGFQVMPTTTRATQMNMGLFDFEAFHGGGSANEDDLDEQWETQQAILRARQGHSKKDNRKQKYKSSSSVQTPKGAARNVKANTPPAKKQSSPPKPFWQK